LPIHRRPPSPTESGEEAITQDSCWAETVF
jgi:hypothetical protein